MQVLGNLSMGLAFFGMMFGLVTGWVLNAVARKRIINPGTLAYVGIALAATVGFSIAMLAMARSTNANPDAYREGEFVGSVVGGIFFPLIITFFIHRSYKRRSATA